MNRPRTLVWFRADLRVGDNTALVHACRRAGGRAGAGVVAAFLISPGEWKTHDYAAARIDLMLRSLVDLSGSLARLSIPLVIETAPDAVDIPAILTKLAAKHHCAELHFNREHELNESRRDEAVLAAFRIAGLQAFAHTDQVCFEPGTIRTGEGRYFTIYSPFKRACFKQWESIGGTPSIAAPPAQAELPIKASPIPQSIAGWKSSVPPDRWPAGESVAHDRLKSFSLKSILEYKDRRDMPGIDGTSQLSPYLTVGSISHRQCIEAAIEANRAANPKLKGNPLEAGSPGPVHWISEVFWREFYIHVMVGFPRVCMHRAFQPATEAIRWNENPKHLEAWKAGRTGVPIVDAGMRQLLRDGWMHNRVRMIVAMYFTKDLFLNWRTGEKWFMRNLVDGFLASNNGGWQWSASTGTDAAPYFRIFNTYSQSEKFDPEGTYIREYVPELRDIEGPAIHDPSQLPGLLRTRLDYPEPLVDRVKAREHAIQTFKALR
ncbi:MAG: deoxyribodipyrimidine photo-lyase [Phycisphaeraceae bacterium]|nr:deoxyribodipyrimidine photo-lyase [Phycisphaeraceae bacterium]